MVLYGLIPFNNSSEVCASIARENKSASFAIISSHPCIFARAHWRVSSKPLKFLSSFMRFTGSVISLGSLSSISSVLFGFFSDPSLVSFFEENPQSVHP
jgi:hypothetical protein